MSEGDNWRPVKKKRENAACCFSVGGRNRRGLACIYGWKIMHVASSALFLIMKFLIQAIFVPVLHIVYYSIVYI